jgi:hypothetical protein
MELIYRDEQFETGYNNQPHLTDKTVRAKQLAADMARALDYNCTPAQALCVAVLTGWGCDFQQSIYTAKQYNRV